VGFEASVPRREAGFPFVEKDDHYFLKTGVGVDYLSRTVTG
jgi:hypothetical protein